jgi:hypothetical protein
MRRLLMKTVARITNGQSAWSRFLRFVTLIEQSTDRDVVTPLYRRLDALEREVEQLRGGTARATAAEARRAAS